MNNIDKFLETQVKGNIIDEEISTKIISETLKKLDIALSKSLGPYGSTSIIRDPHNIDHTITKDGFSILNKIKFNGEMPTVILSMIQKISKNLVQTVGDGSTSSVLVAVTLYLLLEEFFKNNSNIPRKDVLDFLEVLQKDLVIMLKEEAKDIDDVERLTKIATISNNNDEDMGRLVAEIYKELGYTGFIDLNLSDTKETYHKITNGIELLRGYINFVYATEKDKVTAMYENPDIVLCNDVLEDEDLFFIAELLSYSMAKETPIVFIAKEFSPEVMNVMNNNRFTQKDRLKLLPITYGLNKLSDYKQFEDLGIYLNATIYDKYNGERLEAKDAALFFATRMGKCNKIECTEKRTTIIEGNFKQEEIDDRLSIIDKELEELNAKANYDDISLPKEALIRRKSRLKGKIAALYVGGSSDIEKKTKKDLVEDSIYACKSAIDNGYIIGGNLMIPYILTKKFYTIKATYMDREDIFNGKDKEDKSIIIENLMNIVLDSFKSSFKKVLKNKFPDVLVKEEKLIKSKNRIFRSNISLLDTNPPYINDSFEKTKLKENELIEPIIKECLESKLNTLLIYNLKTEKYESIETTNVINSVETDIEIMKTAFSIIGLLASSNQMIAFDIIY